MSPTPIHNPSIRITGLIELKRMAAAITCSPVIQIIPVDFTHRTCRFQALVFVCWFSGREFHLSSVEYNKAFLGVNESSYKIREELILV